MQKDMETAFNDHLNEEFYSAYLYLSMANYFAAENLSGMAGWMQVQFEEEQMHAMKFMNFINDRGGRVLLQPIGQPRTEWPNPLEAFEEAYEHEQMITGRINELVNLASQKNDHAADTFLQWFISEQVEEEATVQGIVGKLKLVKDHPMGLLMIDDQLGKRTAASTAAVTPE